ncbi:hypothetical protein DSCO28_08340 [Desulfosarcina ovata subsp. sediminis]|uniref:Polysaccharide pyruvyl transferase domain-containing protein n=1 Tax=Desulfosarcina ovata subsp. sediminis TaxID=885957 RepID=A0A5K7ZDK1_9BACT|nr:polysaccharide pyruvyl transferase family protein [Desulfosarcina ovata]BBO80268.1 hypothetical protein DSCO28_08340 [Desulfosarcina ovata subsp. sediminis]
MLIEIRKAGFVNKGAELMLHAVLQKVQKSYPESKFAMAPFFEAPYIKRAQLGLLQKVWLWRYRVQWGGLAALVPQKTRQMYGVVLDSEIDIVLDVAGFAYGDQWGSRSCDELAYSCKRWHKQKTKVILLPQALGPFTSARIKDRIMRAVDNMDLIFPRDTISYQYLTDVVGMRSNIIMAPDFTNLLEGILPSDFDVDKNKFCIIPNYRMIDRTSPEQSAAYLPFMVKCSRYLFAKGIKPFLLVHEGENDLKLANQINEAMHGSMAIVQESHPLRIKGIIGACEGTIGSRFHGLVSALSQGVPSLSTGWSHKYKALLNQYNFDDGFTNVMEEDENIFKKIDIITEPYSKKKIQSMIINKSKELKGQTEMMWEKVFKIIGI